MKTHQHGCNAVLRVSGACQEDGVGKWPTESCSNFNSLILIRACTNTAHADWILQHYPIPFAAPIPIPKSLRKNLRWSSTSVVRTKQACTELVPILGSVLEDAAASPNNLDLLNQTRLSLQQCCKPTLIKQEEDCWMSQHCPMPMPFAVPIPEMFLFLC